MEILPILFFLTLFHLLDGFLEKSCFERQHYHLPTSLFHSIKPTRWYGNYKHTSELLGDTPKAKKRTIELHIIDKVGNRKNVTVHKKRKEQVQHVLTMAILWKIFLDDYPNLQIEVDINDPQYLPDVIGLDSSNTTPIFWGESGRMKVHKAVDLMQRYPEAHIVHCRWGMPTYNISAPLLNFLQEEYNKGRLDLSHRPGRFTLASLRQNVWELIDQTTGEIMATQEDLVWEELKFPSVNTSIVGEDKQTELPYR